MWKFFNPFGQEKQLSVNDVAVLPTLESVLGSDLQLTNAGTFYDAASVVLTPGTWFVIGEVDCVAPSMPSNTGFVAKLWDGTTAYDSGEQEGVSGTEAYVRISLSAIITVSVTTTIKLSVACDRSYASSGAVAKAATHIYGSGNNATKLKAIQLTPPTSRPFYAGAVNYVTLAEFAALTPTDGMTVDVVVDAAAGVIWTLRYNAGSASAYKWEYKGGSALHSAVQTRETGSMVSYDNLTTVGPSITLPLPGDYDISDGFFGTRNGSSATGISMSYAIGGTGASSNDEVYVGWGSNAGPSGSVARIARKLALAAVSLVTKYNVGASSADAGARWISATPIRVAQS